MKMKLFTIASALSAAMLLSGCNPTDLADSNVLPYARQYFPLADITHPAQGLLQVNTHVNNISEAFAAKVMAQTLVEHQNDLQMLGFAGISELILAFDTGACGWDTEWDGFFQCRSNGGQVHRYSFYGTLIPGAQTFVAPQ